MLYYKTNLTQNIASLILGNNFFNTAEILIKYAGFFFKFRNKTGSFKNLWFSDFDLPKLVKK